MTDCWTLIKSHKHAPLGIGTIYVVFCESVSFLFGDPVDDLLEPIPSLASGYMFAKQHHSTIFDISNLIGGGVKCRLRVGCQLSIIRSVRLPSKSRKNLKVTIEQLCDV